VPIDDPIGIVAEQAVLPVRSEPLGARGLRMSWRLDGGRALDLLANLGPDPVEAPVPAGEPLYVTHPGWSDAMPPWSVDWSLSQHE
jgi:maltooligosyltrehalose trehalohydrolase